jgi:serine/threonine protein kinase/Tol biopolymer transport system component
MSIPIGAQLGSYEITGLLGKGGMGEVYRARDAKLKREVAIKILPEEFSRESDRVMRFQREAEVLASLNHPNIAAIYDFQEAGGVRFLVLELVEGSTLANRMERGPLPVDETLTITKGICEALEAAHEKAIAHRDLKPANIKITPEGRVKVLDFGLAKMFSPDVSDASLSHSPTMLSASAQGMILGTPSYMSPEQARGQNVDAQSDVWAFGCILYEMLTGQRAFAGDTITDILGGVVRVDPDWSGLPSDTPPLLRLLVRQCLQKPRTARLHHIGDARIQLEASEVEIKSAAAAAPMTATKKRLPFVWIAATAILAAIVAVMAPFAIRHLREAPADPVAVRFSIPPPEKSAFPDGVAAPFATVSHNGRLVAMLAESNGVRRIWIRALDSLEARPLNGTEGASLFFPFWSPDDRSVGFFAQSRLKRVDVAGGAAQIICDVTGNANNVVLSGAWNRDGVIIFSDGVIKRVAASGGKPEPITAIDSARQDLAHIGPEFLPDGNHFLFLAETASAEGSAIMAGSLSSTETKQVVNAKSFAKYDSGRLIFVRDGVLIAQSFDPSKLQVTGDAITLAEQIRQNPNNGLSAFWASGDGTIVYRTGSNTINRKLQWFDRRGRPLGVVGPVAGYRNPELSPDGKRIAVERTDPQTRNGDIWLLDVASGTPNRWTFDPGLDMYPVWSPTGDQIAFGTSRNGADNLYLKASAGGTEELLLKGAAIPRDWSRDNRFLVYGVGAGTQLMVLPLSGERKPFPFLATSSFTYAQSRISPDGKWLAYYSNESGRNEVYVQNFPVASAKYQISNEGGFSSRWRRDGKEIYYVSPEGKLVAVPVRTTEKNIEVGAPSVLFEVGASTPLGSGYGTRQQYDVTADGQRFIVNVPAEQTVESPLTVISNWPATIKR